MAPMSQNTEPFPACRSASIPSCAEKTYRRRPPVLGMENTILRSTWHCYVADSRQMTDGIPEWYYWENIPAQCFLPDADTGGYLWFGTKDGRVCRFCHTDDAHAYSDDGAAIAAHWATPAAVAGRRQQNKKCRVQSAEAHAIRLFRCGNLVPHRPHDTVCAARGIFPILFCASGFFAVFLSVSADRRAGSMCADVCGTRGSFSCLPKTKKRKNRSVCWD